MALTPEQIIQYRQKYGLDSSINQPIGSVSVDERLKKIDDLVASTKTINEPPQNITPEEQKPTSLLDRIKQSFTKRTEDLSKGYQRQIEGKQGLASSALQTAGQGAGFVFDVAGDVLSKGIDILPSIIKKPVADTINKLADSMVHNETIYQGLNAINKGIDTYKEWENQHPEAADNVKALVNLALLVPTGEGAKVSAQAVGKEAGVAGRALEKSGIEAINAEKQSFIRDLVRPLQTKAVKEAQVARTSETGSGIFKKSVIAPTASELKAEEAVLKVEGVTPKNTFQQNFNIIQEHNINAAKELESKIATNDFIIPKKETVARLREAKSSLSSSPTIVGDAQTTAEKLLSKAVQLVNENKGTGSGILKARKEYDAWVKSQKPKAFDANTENAFSLANREVRNTFNNILEEKAPSKGIKESLSHQASLYNAMDVIRTKAAKEADTAIGRILQKSTEILGTKNKVVQGLAAAAGIGGLGAAATFAPAVAAIGGASLLIYQAGKLVLNPNLRIGLGKMLQEVERLLPSATPARKIELNTIKEEINKIVGDEKGFAKIPGLKDSPSMGKIDPLIQEAKKYKTAEEFVKAQQPVYHGSPVPLKSFSNKKGGVFFTQEYADATGFAGSPDNVYEGYLNFKKPLVIDAKGAKWNELNTKFGKSTQEVISNAQGKGYDGVIFKNVVDNIADTADYGGESTIYYAYKPKDTFINESQLIDIWNKVHGK